MTLTSEAVDVVALRERLEAMLAERLGALPETVLCIHCAEKRS